MGVEEVECIKKSFLALELNPTYLEHEAVITSEDAAKTRGFALKQGIKALVFTDWKGAWAVVDMPADLRADSKKIANTLGWSRGNTRMATPEEVLEKTGCEIGAVPPFGHKTSIQLLVDARIYENTESAFNIGLRTHSVKIPTVEMRKVFENEEATEGDFVKE